MGYEARKLESAEWVIRTIKEARRAGADDYQLSNRRIQGVIDLSHLALSFPVLFRNCRFDDEIRLENGRFRTLSFSGCQSKGIMGRNMVIDGDLCLDEGFRSEGTIQIEDSVIDGSLKGAMAVFDDPHASRCLQAKGLRVRGDIRAEGSCFHGEVKLANAQVGGDMIFANCLFDSKSYALNLSGARITGQVLLERTGLYRENQGLCDGMVDPWIDKGFEKPEETQWFQSRGVIYLDNARIGSDLVLSNARLLAGPAPGKPVLEARGARIEGDVYLRSDFIAHGTVEMRSAWIQGNLDCRGGRFIGSHQQDGRFGDAIGAFGLKVDGEILFGSSKVGLTEVDSRVIGILNFNSSQVLKNFKCVDLIFVTPATDPKGAPANCCGLDLTNAKISGDLRWQPTQVDDGTVLRLSYANAGNFIDDLARGIRPGCLFLDGFTYKKIGRGTEEVEDRLGWLRLQPIHTEAAGEASLVWPQTFDELARFYRSVGLPREAKRVLFEKEEEFLEHFLHQRRNIQEKGWRSRLRKWAGISIEIFGRTFLKWTIGYGYRFHLLFLYFSLFLVVGSVIFMAAEQHDYIQRINADIADWSRMAPGNIQPPVYRTISYSLDTLIPVVNLHQYSHWVIESSSGGRRLFAALLEGYLWCHIFAGWVITSLVVGGITGVFKE